VRVLTVIHLYPPHHLGGYEVACQGAMERFAEQGVEVEVLTSAYRHEGVEDTPSKIPVRRELRGWWDMDAWALDHPSLSERVRRERHNQKALRRALEEFRPDVASVWDLGMMSWTLGAMLEGRRLPIVLTFLDDWVSFAYVFDAWTRIFDKRPWARPLGRVLGLETRLPSFRTALASTASRMIADSIETHSRWKFPQAELVSLGVETRDFPVSEPEGKPWSWRILYVGRVVPHKGVATLVRALALLPPEARLDFVGHAHETQRMGLAALADELGVADRIGFSLASSREDLRQRYRSADVVVFPSEWPEPFGLVPLEAMATGVPVVATGTGGSGEYLVHGGNCLVFTPGDPDALAAAVRRVAEDPELRRQITEGGSATARELTMDRFAEGVLELHERALSSSGSR